MRSAALETAGSSTRGRGWAPGAPAFSWERQNAQSRQACPEEAQEPSWGTGKGWHVDHSAKPSSSSSALISFSFIDPGSATIAGAATRAGCAGELNGVCRTKESAAACRSVSIMRARRRVEGLENGRDAYERGLNTNDGMWGKWTTAMLPRPY